MEVLSQNLAKKAKRARQPCRALLLDLLFCIANADIQGFRIKSEKPLVGNAPNILHVT
jgi:hypothetical protein